MIPIKSTLGQGKPMHQSPTGPNIYAVHIKLSFYAKEITAVCRALKKSGHIFCSAAKPIINMTDSKLVRRFLKKRMITPPPLWMARDFVLQLIFVIAHILGKVNTAPELSNKI